MRRGVAVVAVAVMRVVGVGVVVVVAAVGEVIVVARVVY